MINQTDSSIPRVNDSAKERYAELTAQWKKLEATAIEILEQDVPGYNKLLWEEGIGAVRKKIRSGLDSLL